MFNIGKKKGGLDPRGLWSDSTCNIYEHRFVGNFIHAFLVCAWVLVFPRPEFSKCCAKVFQAFSCRIIDSGFLQPLYELQKEITYLRKDTTALSLDWAFHTGCEFSEYFFSSSCLCRLYSMEFRKGSGNVAWSRWT